MNVTKQNSDGFQGLQADNCVLGLGCTAAYCTSTVQHHLLKQGGKCSISTHALLKSVRTTSHFQLSTLCWRQ